MHQFNQRFKIQRQSFKVFCYAFDTCTIVHIVHDFLLNFFNTSIATITTMHLIQVHIVGYMTFYLTFSTLLLQLHEDEVALYFLWNKLNHALSSFCIKVSITYNLVWRRPR